MRKTWILALAATAAAFAGCQREEVMTPDAPLSQHFTAGFEAITRVSFTDEGLFSWKEGDEIGVPAKEMVDGVPTPKRYDFTLTSGAGTAQAEFTTDKDVANLDANPIAVVPASDLDVSNPDAPIKLPASYTWAEGQSNAVMVATDLKLDGANTFKHVGGIVKVTYKNIPAEADGFMLAADAGIWGSFALQDGVIVAGPTPNHVKVSFTPGASEMAFYVPVPTGEYKLEASLTSKGYSIPGTKKETSAPVKIARKTLLLMDALTAGTAEPVTVTVSTAQELKDFLADASNFGRGSKLIVAADIDAGLITPAEAFYGDVDGQGHKITYREDIPETGTDSYSGLFGYIDGSVKNLKVAGEIQTKAIKNAAIAAECAPNAVFENCESDVDIHMEVYGVSGPKIAGILGVAGDGTTLKGCKNTGDLSYIVPGMGKGRSTQIGGIVGNVSNHAVIENCVNEGELRYEAEGNPRSGGMIGYINDPVNLVLRGCVNRGYIVCNVTISSGYNYMGGMTGYVGTNTDPALPLEKVLFENCTNYGKVEALGIATLCARLGGIASYAGMTDTKMNAAGLSDSGQLYEFRGCKNYGEIATAEGTTKKVVLGGIVGFGEKVAKVVIDGCLNDAPVTTSTTTGNALYLGGVIGGTCGLQSSVTDVLIGPGTVITGGSKAVAGLIGGNNAKYTTNMTGKVTGGKIIKGTNETVATAENFQSLLCKVIAGTTTGVVFEGAEVLFAGGSGTEADPYRLRTADDLAAFAAKVNDEATYADFAEKSYVLLADVDMAGKTIVPIGKYKNFPFKGQFDGTSRTIANLAVDGESSDNPVSGLFGYAVGAKLSNIVLKDRTNAGSFGYTAGLVGRADDCQIIGCSIIGGTLKTGNSYAGGITAYLGGGEITSCTIDGLTIESAHNHIGGLVGELFDGAVSGCTARGVKIAGKQNVGGFFGWFDKGSATNCLLTQSEVTGSGDGVGGFTGRTISKKGATNLYDKCRVEDSVIKGAYSVGGIIGYAYPDANGPVLVYNSGILKTTVRATACDTGGDPAKGDSMIAGICGWMRASDNASSAKIVNCYIHFAPGGLVCDLPMVNASAGAILGYVSLSAAGTIEVANCCTSLGADDLVVGGAPVGSSSARYGALYGMLPDRVITVKHNYCVSGLPMTGSTGASVVLEENEAYALAELGGATEKLNAFAASYSDYNLSSWAQADGLPMLK